MVTERASWGRAVLLSPAESASVPYTSGRLS